MHVSEQTLRGNERLRNKRRRLTIDKVYLGFASMCRLEVALVRDRSSLRWGVQAERFRSGWC